MNEWHTAATTIRSVGFVWKQDKKGISLSHSLAADGDSLCVQFIPAGMIKKVKRLS